MSASRLQYARCATERSPALLSAGLVAMGKRASHVLASALSIPSENDICTSGYNHTPS